MDAVLQALFACIGFPSATIVERALEVLQRLLDKLDRVELFTRVQVCIQSLFPCEPHSFFWIFLSIFFFSQSWHFFFSHALYAPSFILAFMFSRIPLPVSPIFSIFILSFLLISLSFPSPYLLLLFLCLNMIEWLYQDFFLHGLHHQDDRVRIFTLEQITALVRIPAGADLWVRVVQASVCFSTQLLLLRLQGALFNTSPTIS